MNGSDQERRLAKHLAEECGFAVMRSPASGSATDRDQPDLFYGSRHSGRYAMELKTTSANIAYYELEEVDALTTFANAMAARPVLGARFKGDTSFYVYSITQSRNTPSGKYAVDRDMQAMEVFEP